MTPYHALLWAHLLTRRCPPESPEMLAGTVAGARVDLNPHQIDAALFAFKSPISRGVLLADEVGLGKTIEAGLVLAQRWAERRRRLLVITPSNLRKQWQQELTEKFFLPCEIIEAKTYNQKVRSGNLDPMGSSASILICSYQFARNKAVDMARTPWDLVVIDEAHRLRNVYKANNVIANTLKKALAQPQKLLLTATPLQNSLLELFGLVGFIDDYVFGDIGAFKNLYSQPTTEAFQNLRQRLAPLCHRTLRKQVRQYVPYTHRKATLKEFEPSQAEDELYELVSEYLRRPELAALPKGPRTLIVMVMRKLLASSTFAIAGALATMAKRMRAKIARAEVNWLEELGQDVESLDATAEEFEDDTEEEELTPEQIEAMKKEIAELEEFSNLASSIQTNAKGKVLVQALEAAFANAREMNAAPKAVIFTESRKTQDYLQRVLADTPWANGIVLFNGTNTDAKSAEIYKNWLARHQGSDQISGSKSADMRAALVEEFRERGEIMIATEAGAEGINLQFCSLVVNYDLPWNPQRIEQRIGRCHRYGQKHDVVVVNFINKNNAADQRVYALLAEKFRLFEGVFGASDEILGAIESGVDFERRITAIYQECRKPEEIKAAFDKLQEELSPEIDQAMKKARRDILEYLDEEVRDRLRLRDEHSKLEMSRFENMLLDLTRYELGDAIEPVNASSFKLLRLPSHLETATGSASQISLGLYALPRATQEARAYHMGHPLAEAIIKKTLENTPCDGEIVFDLSGHKGRISALEPYLGSRGELAVQWLSVEASAQSEDHVVWSAMTKEGTLLPPDIIEKMFKLKARVEEFNTAFHEIPDAMDAQLLGQIEKILGDVQARNTQYLDDESAKLDAWADDVKRALERELNDIDREMRETKKAAKAEKTLEGKLTQQKRLKSLEGLRTQKRKSLFEAQDKIDNDREALLDTVEARLKENAMVKTLFVARWRLV